MQDTKKVINRIFQLKNEYRDLNESIDMNPHGDSVEIDPMVYPELLRIRKELVCLSLDLAISAGKIHVSWKNAKAQREVQHYLAKKKFLGPDHKMKIGAAEAAAKIEVKDLIIEEGEHEGLYRAENMILSQVNEILKALAQDISIVKKEYESINKIN